MIQQSFLMTIGSPWFIQLQLWEDAAATVPMNLTGYGIELKTFGGEIVISTDAQTIDVIDAANGKIQWKIDTSTFEQKPYPTMTMPDGSNASIFDNFELMLKDPTGEVDGYMQGLLYLGNGLTY